MRCPGSRARLRRPGTTGSSPRLSVDVLGDRPRVRSARRLGPDGRGGRLAGERGTAVARARQRQRRSLGLGRGDRRGVPDGAVGVDPRLRCPGGRFDHPILAEAGASRRCRIVEATSRGASEGHHAAVRMRISREDQKRRLRLGARAGQGRRPGRPRQCAPHGRDEDRHHPSQGSRAAGGVHGLARRADGASEPDPVPGQVGAGSRRREGARLHVRRPRLRPRSLQDRQRHAGPFRGRRPPEHRRATIEGDRARRRHGRTPRRRRIRDRPRTDGAAAGRHGRRASRHRRDRAADGDRGARDQRQRQRRHRDRRRRGDRRRATLQEGGYRALPIEGGGSKHLLLLRARHGSAPRRAGVSRTRSAGRVTYGMPVSRLPARGPARDRRGHRLRGADALAPPHARHGISVGLHSHRRGDRSDRRARGLGAARSLPRGGMLARAPSHRRQRVDDTVSPTGPRAERDGEPCPRPACRRIGSNSRSPKAS